MPETSPSNAYNLTYNILTISLWFNYLYIYMMFVRGNKGAIVKTLILGSIYGILISSIFIYLLADYNWQMSLYLDGEYHDNLWVFYKFFTAMVLGVIPLSILTGIFSAYWTNKNKDLSKEGIFTILFDCFFYSMGSGLIGGFIIWIINSVLSELFLSDVNMLIFPINIIIKFIVGTSFFIPVSCVFALMTMTGGMIFAIIYLTFFRIKRLLASSKMIND